MQIYNVIDKILDRLFLSCIVYKFKTGYASINDEQPIEESFEGG